MSNCNIKKPQIASKCKRKLFPLINLQALKVTSLTFELKDIEGQTKPNDLDFVASK